MIEVILLELIYLLNTILSLLFVFMVYLYLINGGDLRTQKIFFTWILCMYYNHEVYFPYSNFSSQINLLNLIYSLEKRKEKH